jgi:hypothetical protein
MFSAWVWSRTLTEEMAMTTPGDLKPTLRGFVDILRGLKPQDLDEEDQAWLRAIQVELNWLLGQPEPEAGNQAPT